MYRDYEPQGVRFYYIYKLLAHPEKHGFVQPFTIEERLLHIREAKRRLGVKVPWLCDTMSNDLVHALGNAPTSEFIIDPDGNVARKRAWGNAQRLRQDLKELVGAVEDPTRPEDLGLTYDLDTAPVATGVVERIEVPRAMRPVVVEPIFDTHKTPFYAKLRADADDGLLREGNGKLYLGFHLDPLYGFHWNNLTKPIHVEIDPSGNHTEAPRSLDGPAVGVESDADPREFLFDVAAWDVKSPIKLTVRYFACNDERGVCVPVRQQYLIRRKFDRDSGWPARRARSLPPKEPQADGTGAAERER